LEKGKSSEEQKGMPTKVLYSGGRESGTWRNFTQERRNGDEGWVCYGGNGCDWVATRPFADNVFQKDLSRGWGLRWRGGGKTVLAIRGGGGVGGTNFEPRGVKRKREQRELKKNLATISKEQREWKFHTWGSTGKSFGGGVEIKRVAENKQQRSRTG